jgi:hypothetical protein
LLAIAKQYRTVKREHVRDMTRLPPTKRIEWIGEHIGHEVQVGGVIASYESFLVKTDAPEHELVAKFCDAVKARDFSEHANELGDAMAALLSAVGQGTRLYRLLVV